jgi:hypothetical protein
MNDTHKGILDREYSVEMVRHFKDDIALLNEILDYGSHLLPKAYANSPRDIKAMCIILVQLRQVLVHLDGIAILLSAGNCFSAGLQIRSLLEIAHTLEWLLSADTETKIHHLYVANLRKRRRWQSAAISGTPESTRHADAASRIPLTTEQLQTLNDEIRRINEILAMPEFSAIDAKFQLNYASRNFDKPWYEVYGSSSNKISIRHIADAIGKLKEYNYIYSYFSAVTHGGDIFKNVTFEGNIYINPVRDPQDVPKVRLSAASLAFRVYRMILEQYLASELDEFNKKYSNEWSARFLKEYSINISPIDTMI